MTQMTSINRLILDAWNVTHIAQHNVTPEEVEEGYRGRTMTTKKTTSKSSRIPEFKSREEEAEFWDTHSTADYEDEFKRVRVRVSKKLSEGLTIRLDQDTLKNVRTLAHEKGIGPTTLIRMWVMERMKEAPHHSQGL